MQEVKDSEQFLELLITYFSNSESDLLNHLNLSGMCLLDDHLR